MVDLLADGAAWLDEQRHAYMTRTVTFRRGNQSVDVHATVGKTMFRLNDSTGASVVTVSRDYLIRAADLILPSEVKPTLPRRGDQIDEIDGEGKVRVHEVLGPGASGGGEPEWRYSDVQRRVLRIHTKEISVSE